MYFYLAKVGFEPTPTSTAAPSNTETTVIPTRPLRSLKKELSWSRYSGQGSFLMRVHPKNKLYDREIKMYFYLAKVGFEPTPTSTAALYLLELVYL